MAIKVGDKLLVYADPKAVEKWERYLSLIAVTFSGFVVFSYLNSGWLGLAVSTPVLLLLIGLCWLEFRARKNMKSDKPLIYTFDETGFTVHWNSPHKGHHLWSDFKYMRITEYESRFIFKGLIKQVMSIQFASSDDQIAIARHIKTHAPDRLSRKIH